MTLFLRITMTQGLRPQPAAPSWAALHIDSCKARVNAGAGLGVRLLMSLIQVLGGVLLPPARSARLVAGKRDLCGVITRRRTSRFAKALAASSFLVAHRRDAVLQSSEADVVHRAASSATVFAKALQSLRARVPLIIACSWLVQMVAIISVISQPGGSLIRLEASVFVTEKKRHRRLQAATLPVGLARVFMGNCIRGIPVVRSRKNDMVLYRWLGVGLRVNELFGCCDTLALTPVPGGGGGLGGGLAAR